VYNNSGNRQQATGNRQQATGNRQQATVISIVTPCFNAEKYIRMTIESVLNQTVFKNGRAVLDYIIIDGGSTDGTLKVIEDIVNQHTLKNHVKIISEPDNGMYDALAKGMKLACGEIFAYINADDYYNITALDVVLTIMKKYPVKWLTGWATGYNEQGHITGMNSQYLFRKNFIAKGVYGTQLPHLQQESTFWLRELNEHIDYEKLKSFKYAGDYYLWVEFAKHTFLFIVETYLGGFRSREGQLSKQMEKYNIEKRELLSGRLNIFDKLIIIKDKIFWHINKLHKIFKLVKNESGEYVHFIYNHIIQEYEPLSLKFIKDRIFGRK
jgi:glycosyltransferase involved in cell wall biosynthesis